jgi:hypothetical protein
MLFQSELLPTGAEDEVIARSSADVLQKGRRDTPASQARIVGDFRLILVSFFHKMRAVQSLKISNGQMRRLRTSRE